MSTAQLQALARRTRDEAEPVRAVHCRLDRRRDWGRVSGRLPAQELELAAATLQRLADTVPVNPETGGLDPYESRCADALVELAVQAAGDDGERPTVVVHVTAEALAGDGEGQTAEGSPIDNAVVQRMACDGRIGWWRRPTAAWVWDEPGERPRPG